jgi:hypothetical protein
LNSPMISKDALLTATPGSNGNPSVIRQSMADFLACTLDCQRMGSPAARPIFLPTAPFAVGPVASIGTSSSIDELGCEAHHLPVPRTQWCPAALAYDLEAGIDGAVGPLERVTLVRTKEPVEFHADVPEPVVDVDDIADVVAAALTEPGHAGEAYEVTGPRLLRFAEAAAELSRATARTIAYQQISHDAFVAGVADSGAPEEVVSILDYRFVTVLDGRNAHLADGVQRALDRPPKDFADYARDTAKTSIWRSAA